MTQQTNNRRNALIALGVVLGAVTTANSAAAGGKPTDGAHADVVLGEALTRYADEPAALPPSAATVAMPITEVTGERSHFAAHARRLVKDLTATGGYSAEELVAIKLIWLDAEQEAAAAEQDDLPRIFADFVADLVSVPLSEADG